MDYSPKAWLNNRPWLTAFLFFIATYCLNLFISRDLWVQDEMRYGEVVREMLATGNWLVPHLNGAPYPDKPATYFWIVSAVSMLIGQGEMAFRLVSALSTLLAGSGVYLIGNKMAGRECGFWSAIIFGSTLLTLIVGQIVRMDMLLTAITTFTWLALLEFDSTAKKRHLIEFWVCCALSLAVKGPISLLFTLLPSIIWTLNKKGLAGLRQLRPILGLLAIIGMVIAWVVMVFQSGQGPYLSKIWHEQLVGRAINSWSHKEPIYFYLLLLPIFIMPWTGPILSGIWKTVKQDHTHISSIIFFALVPLIGISLVSGKLFIYIEPLVPALCIAGALAIEKTDQKTKVKAWYAWPPTLYLFGVSGLLVYLSKLYLGETSTQGIWIAIGVTMLAIISAIATQFNIKRWLYTTSTLSVLFSWLIFGGMTTLLNPLFSAKAMTNAVLMHANDSTPIAVINTTRGILNYYANRTFSEVKLRDANAWAKAHPDAVLIIKTSDLKAAFPESTIPNSCQVNKTFNMELKEYHVLAKC